MPFDNPSASQTPEIALGRLLRCMTATEREQVLLAVLRILSRRDRDERVEASPNLDDWIMSAWPSDWPGRHLVELDNVGDPGAWLSNLGGEPISQMLFGWAWDDETNASSLADEYLREIRRQGYPLPSDFGDAPCPNGWSHEDEQQARIEFMAFLRHWRERVLQVVEEQDRPDK